MIKHLIHYYDNGFCLSWEMQLPFRLNKGDYLNNEILDESELIHGEKTDEWVTLCKNNQHFLVNNIIIYLNKYIVVMLGLPSDSLSSETSSNLFTNKSRIGDNKLKIGDNVECVWVHIHNLKCLTKGKKYEVVDIGYRDRMDRRDTIFYIRDDNREKKQYFLSNSQFKKCL